MAAQDTLEKPIEELESVVIRLAGDSGDGMQLTGGQFTRTAALFGNDISTLPDFPAEIRAPAGSLPGVSSFQLNFSSRDIYTPGDAPQVLVAMNPAGLKTNIGDLEDGGILLINTDAFTKANLNKAGYKSNPLEDGSLSRYRVFKMPITSLNAKALEGLEMAEGEDFPLGEKVLRKEDHQAFNREFIFQMKDGKYKILEIVPKEKTMFPPACKFA